MIKTIEIQNFKSVQQLTLELGRINVLIGENGCGKSNLLEGIAFGAAAAADKLDFLSAYGIRVTEPDKFLAGFKKEASEKEILIQFTDKNHKNFDFKIRAMDQEWQLQSELPRHKIPINIRNFKLYAPENHFLRRFEEETQIKPLGIRGEGLFSHLVELAKSPQIIQKIQEQLELINWFDGFDIPMDLLFNEHRLRLRDRFLTDGLGYFDQRSANEGFLYILFYITLLLSPKTPTFFAIDNLDNALNPKLCTKLVQIIAQLAEEQQKQILFIAHNPAILDGLDLKKEEHRLFVVSRSRAGETKVTRLQHKPLPIGQSPVRLSEHFMNGAIGGLPKNF
jgi:predicted ATPase